MTKYWYLDVLYLSSFSQPVSLSLPFTKVLWGLGWCELHVLPVPVPGASPGSLGARGGRTTARTPSRDSHSSSIVHPPPPHCREDPLYPARFWGYPVHPFNQNSISPRYGLWTQPYCQPRWVNCANYCSVFHTSTVLLWRGHRLFFISTLQFHLILHFISVLTHKLLLRAHLSPSVLPHTLFTSSAGCVVKKKSHLTSCFVFFLHPWFCFHNSR